MTHYIVISIVALASAAVLLFDYDFPGHRQLVKKYKEQLKNTIALLLLFFVIAYDMLMGNSIHPALPWKIYSMSVIGLMTTTFVTIYTFSLNSRGKRLSNFFALLLILFWLLEFIYLYMIIL